MDTTKKDIKRKQLFDRIINEHITGNWDVTQEEINKLSKIELIRLTTYLLFYYPAYYIDITGSKKYQIYDTPK